MDIWIEKKTSIKPIEMSLMAISELWDSINLGYL